MEPVSPALAGGFLTTGPPGRSLIIAFNMKKKKIKKEKKVKKFLPDTFHCVFVSRQIHFSQVISN